MRATSDALPLGGASLVDLRGLTLTERNLILRDSLEESGTLVYASGIVGAGVAVFALLKLHGFECMIAKRMCQQRGQEASCKLSCPQVGATICAEQPSMSRKMR
jgi:hypothetical protein